MRRSTLRQLRNAAIERQHFAAKLSDAAALDVGDAIVDLWKHAERAALDHRSNVAAHNRLTHISRLLVPVSRLAIDASLRKIASWGLADVSRRMAGILPKPLLVASRVVNVRESRDQITAIQLVAKILGPNPGDVDLVSVFADTPKDDLSAWLFPGPTPDEVKEIVYAAVNGISWRDRLATATKTSATPERIASILADGWNRGRTVPEIAKALRPIVDGVKSTAKRIARTEGMRIALQTQEKQWAALGDFVLGYQVHAVLDERTRRSPNLQLDHYRRDGLIYYKQPKRGQLGMDDCPHPPLEAKNNGSVYAWNCRCTLSPVLDYD
jgi:hypothetical protein